MRWSWTEYSAAMAPSLGVLLAFEILFTSATGPIWILRVILIVCAFLAYPLHFVLSLGWDSASAEISERRFKQKQ